MQEFVLRRSSDGRSFVPGNCAAAVEFQSVETVTEVENYNVELSQVTILELKITPDISGGIARAALKSLRLS
jgi:hypothetical protein